MTFRFEKERVQQGCSKIGKAKVKATRFLIGICERVTNPGIPRFKQESNIKTELNGK
jgi:hypothetical protein